MTFMPGSSDEMHRAAARAEPRVEPTVRSKPRVDLMLIVGAAAIGWTAAVALAVSLLI